MALSGQTLAALHAAIGDGPAHELAATIGEQESVTDFGATGNGTTDDSAAITLAINAVYNAGGGVVHFPRGTYLAANLPIYEGVYYRGDGIDQTIIELYGNITATSDLFRATLTGAFDDGGFSDMTLRSGNSSNGYNTSYDGISFAGVTGALNRYRLKNVAFVGFRDQYHGPDAGNNFPSGTPQNEFETYISNCSFDFIARTATFTAAATDICTSASHGLREGAKIRVSSSTTLPAGLSADTDYYVRDVTTHTFKLAELPGAPAINITDAGTGTHTLRTGTRSGCYTFENPHIISNQFNGPGNTSKGVAGTGIMGRISDTFVAHNHFYTMDHAVDCDRKYIFCQAEADDDVITAAAHGLVDGQQVTFGVATGGSLPGNISAGTLYYVRDVTTDTFKVSATSGGSAVNISSDGSLAYVLCANCIINSQFVGNIFYSPTAKSGGFLLAIDQSCDVIGNWFEGLGQTTAPEIGLLVRGRWNNISGNMFCRASGTLKGGFSTAAIQFTRTTFAGEYLTAVGLGTTITGNKFWIEDGPGIKGDTYESTSAPEHTGINISGNSFYVVADKNCILFSASTGGGANPFCRGNNFSGNDFYLNFNNLTAAPIRIVYSYYGNRICDNSFRCASGLTMNTPMISGHLQASMVQNNRVHGWTPNAATTFPFDIAQIGASTTGLRGRLQNNSVTDSNGTEIINNAGVLRSIPAGCTTERRLLGVLRAANMNVNTDQPIYINSSRYIIEAITVDNASISLDTAVGGIYPTTSKGGTAIVANSQVYSALSSAAKYVNLTLAAGVGTDVNTATTIYLSLTTPQGAAATADVRVWGRALD